MVIGLTTYKRVHGFSEEQLRLIKAFLQGAVYCWCKNRKDEWFAVRDLLGGGNFDEFINDVDMGVIKVKHDHINQNCDKLKVKVILDCCNICPFEGVYHI